MMTSMPRSFWMETRMLCGKDGKQDSDTEWRLYPADDVLPIHSPRQQILHIRSGWRLTFPSLWRLAVSGTFISKQKSCQLMDDGRQRPEVGRRISTLFFCAIPSSQYPPATASMMSAALCVAGSFKKAPYWTTDVPPPYRQGGSPNPNSYRQSSFLNISSC